MTVQAITLMEAYVLESLRVSGITNEALIEINDRSIEEWKEKNTQFDLSILKQLADNDRDKFKSIINDGYQIKFLTINGLINLIEWKFAKKKDVDFTTDDSGISNLIVNNKEREQIEQMLSANWQVIETEEGLLIQSGMK